MARKKDEESEGKRSGDVTSLTKIGVGRAMHGSLGAGGCERRSVTPSWLLLAFEASPGPAMFFSRTQEEPVEATGSASNAGGGGAATSVPASASAAASASTGEWETKGAAGLGAISSMSAECTPLKHRYDSCFNLWFKDYLAIGDDQIQEQQRRSQTSSTASSSTNAAGTKKKSGWFSDSSSSSTSTDASSMADSDVEGRKNAIMQRYERDCAQLFKDYQACIKVCMHFTPLVAANSY